MTVIEKAEQEFGDKQGRMRFIVLDVADAVTARALVNAMAPAISAGLVKQDVIVNELGGGHWEADVPYGVLERPEQGSVPFSFEIGSQQLHITQAVAHVADYVATGLDANDFNHRGTIGVRDDGNGGQTAEGCDVFIKYFKWSETHYFPYAVVATHSWIQTHEALVCTINQDPFRVWAKGELLLLSVTGQKQGETLVPVTYSFASSRSVTAEEILLPESKKITYNKEGHHYSWLEYRSEESGSELAHRPVALHVEQVYRYGDWQTDLPLPDPWN